MTPLSLLLSWFPSLVMAGTLACLVWLLLAPSIVGALALIFILYGLPLVVYHLHQRFCPVLEGITYLLGKEYSPWWGSHQIQVIYIAFPLLETILRLIPGLFSLWLRLWGSQVGQAVYWTPSLEVADRGLLEIGDRVIFGQRIALSSHVIKPKRNDLMLYVQKVQIGSNAFLGAGVAIGPGTTIPEGAYIPFGTILFRGRQLEEFSEIE